MKPLKLSLGLRSKFVLLILAVTGGMLIATNTLWTSLMPADLSAQTDTAIDLIYIWEAFGLGVVLWLSFMLAGHFLSPIRQLRNGSNQIGGGDFKHRLDISTGDELADLGEAFNRMALKLQELYRGMQEDQARLEASINSINLGFIMTDATLSIITINRAAMELLAKLPPEPSAAKADWGIDLIAHQLSRKIDITAHLRTCLEKQKPTQLQEISSGERILDIFIAPIIAGPNVFGTTMVINDVTEAKIAQRSKNEFFSIASHELRTPLTVIKGNSSMIGHYYGGQLKDRRLRGMITDIYQSSVRLIQIVNDFLDTSRIEQGRIQFINQELDLPALAAESIHEMEPLAQHKHIKLSQSNPGGPVPAVTADRNRVKQVLFNLIDNAIKFTETGSVTVAIKAGRHLVKVSVKDTGRGVPRENRALLFRKFQQASTNLLTRDSAHGTGLGLYISKALIEGMGGRLYLAKSGPSGSEFAFTLPLATKTPSTPKLAAKT